MQPTPCRIAPPPTVLTAIPVFAVGVLLAGCNRVADAVAPAPASIAANNAAQPGLEGKIVFHSSRDGNFEIYAMNADGSDQTRLTYTDDHEIDPAWSWNGKQIGFTVFPADFSSDPEIYVMNADGTGRTQLTDNDATDFGPLWSPDGKRIAFLSDRDGDRDIYMMDPDGSNVKRVTHGAYVVQVTAWSPNGKQLAFSSYRDYVLYGDAGDLEIMVVNADGTGMKQLTDNNVDDEGDHAGWSPDGKLFSFSSRRDGGDLDIFVMNADGSDVRQVTGVGGDTADDDDSVWSPNGRHLAFQSTRDGDEEVYTANVDGTDVRQLTHNTDVFDAVPGWASGKVH